MTHPQPLHPAAPRMWHVGELGDENYDDNPEQSGGWIVLAADAESAIEQVKAAEHAFYLENRERYTERFYHLGIRKDQTWPLRYAARPIGGVYRIPFLGYSW